MKTITELKDDAKALEKQAKAMFNELAELQKAERHRDDVPDILKWLDYANKHQLTGHGLVKRKDTALASAYLSLLFSVAMCQSSPAGKISPLVHPCSIAASLKNKINTELIFKKSLSLDEIAIRKYCDLLREAEMDSLFILDALILTGRYEDKNHSKLEYIADLAAIMEISQVKMREILVAAKAIIEESEFVGKLLEVPFEDFYYYLESCPAKIIETSNKFMAVSNKPFTWKEAFNSKFDFENKKEVSFANIQFSARNTRYSFANIERLAFDNCNFSGFRNGVFQADNIDDVSISDCSFSECVLSIKSKEVLSGYMYANDDDIVKDLKSRATRSRVEGEKINTDLETEIIGRLNEAPLLNLVEKIMSERAGRQVVGEKINTDWETGIIGRLNEVTSLSISNTSFNNCYGEYLVTVEEYSRFGSNEKKVRDIKSIKHNNLFAGISKSKINFDKDDIERINSCPIC